MPQAAGSRPARKAKLIREHPTDGAIRVAAFAVAELGVSGLFGSGKEEKSVAAIWQTMIAKIAAQSRVTLSPGGVEEIVAAALASVAPYTFGSKVVGWTMTGVLSALTGTVVPAATAVNMVFDIVFTYRLGKECARRFTGSDTADFAEIDFGQRLVAPPTVAEVAAIGSLLANREWKSRLFPFPLRSRLER